MDRFYDAQLERLRLLEEMFDHQVAPDVSIHCLLFHAEPDSTNLCNFRSVIIHSTTRRSVIKNMKSVVHTSPTTRRVNLLSLTLPGSQEPPCTKRPKG